MLKIMFICHGNICRSPMAEYIMQDMLRRKNICNKVMVSSSATSTDALGCAVHKATREILEKEGIDSKGKCAVQLKASDYQNYDYILGMDQANVKNATRIFGRDKDNKIHRLLDYTACPRDILDPWYTGDFETTFEDIVEGLNGFFDKVIKPYVNYNKL